MKPLSDVKEGGVVTVDYGEGYPPKLCDVSYVVPGDYFQANGNHKWNFDGTSKYAGYDEARVRLATQEEIDSRRAERDRLVAEFRGVDWDQIKFGDLKSIIPLVRHALNKT
jgi:hypothetical protein